MGLTLPFVPKSYEGQPQNKINTFLNENYKL